MRQAVKPVFSNILSKLQCEPSAGLYREHRVQKNRADFIWIIRATIRFAEGIRNVSFHEDKENEWADGHEDKDSNKRSKA